MISRYPIRVYRRCRCGNGHVFDSLVLEHERHPCPVCGRESAHASCWLIDYDDGACGVRADDIPNYRAERDALAHVVRSQAEAGGHVNRHLLWPGELMR